MNEEADLQIAVEGEEQHCRRGWLMAISIQGSQSAQSDVVIS